MLCDVIVKVKAVVEFFKRSSLAQTKLEVAQRQMNLPLLKLKQECPTRWNSCYDMLERILKIKDAVISTIALIRSDLSLQTSEWELIEKIVPILRPFYEVTQEISSEKHVSLSKVLIFTKFLSKHIQKAFRTPEAYNRAIENLRRRVAAVRVQVADSNVVEGHSRQEPQVAIGTTNSIWEEFDVEMSQATRPESSVAAGIRELDKYLHEEPLNRKNDPLKWWHSRKHIYPHLYELVLKRLCIQATSVSCERVFSSAGQIVTDRRKLLKPSKVTQTLFLHNNM
ncbi:unnamed protein product [Parnassius mnemosyne]|uniref:HAT C-terminal dimerisation domain-containing protein n=1 Tax=Parnassius mnemosyne TaxID=213953 RepID=A0AAV1LYZ6_9NEOP